MKRFLFTLALAVAACTTAPPASDSVRIATTAIPLSSDPGVSTAGSLRYLGGLVIASPDPRFGGFSGLRVRDDGWALSVSDLGEWAGFRLVERNGRLIGVSDFHIAPMFDAAGAPPASKDAADAESVEWAADGTATVGFEQDHRFETYAGIDPAHSMSFAARPQSVARPDFMHGWPKNGGAEAFAAIAPDAELVISEDELIAPDVHDAVVTFDGQVIRFGYRAPPGFAPTDAVGIGNGRALVLHRHFTKADGPAAIVGLADFANVKPGQVVVPREIARLAPPLTVDNMEGIATRREGGRTFVYLISDDNQSRAQRTLLMKFELLP